MAVSSPTQYVREYSAFQNDIERQIFADVSKTFAEVVPRRAAGSLASTGGAVTLAPLIRSREDLLAEALRMLIIYYGPVAMSFGMYLFERYAQEKAVALLDDGLSAATSSIYGLIRKSDNPLPLLQGSISRHVMNRSRGVIHESAAKVPNMAYARVPHYVGQRDGKGPCEFCIVLASRGPVYATTVTAGGRGTGNEYHDECYCIPTIMKASSGAGDQGDPADWPKGYRPDRIYKDIYSPNHAYNDRIQDVTRKIRESDPDFV